MADLLDDLLARVAKIVYTFEGTIIDVAGDGALCVFGAPISHEDDAARALRSSLAILDAVGAIGGHARAPEVRMGVDSGNVVLRSIGRDYRLKYSAIGDAVQLRQKRRHLPGCGRGLGLACKGIDGAFDDGCFSQAGGASQPFDLCDNNGICDLQGHDNREC